jgi:glycosyltransferase 2 family protein
MPRNALGLLISAISLAAFLWWASQQERPTFPTAPRDIALLVLAVGVYGLVTVSRGWRWHSVLENAELRHRASDAYGLMAVGYMGNTVLPARGGELLRILLMADRSGARKREVLGSIIAERLLDAITLLGLLTALSLTGLVGSGAGREIALAGLVAVVGVITAWVLYKRLRRRGKFGRFADLASPVVYASRSLANRHGAVLAAVTLGIWWLEALVFWLVARSVHADVTLVESLFVVVFTSVVIAIPAGPGYLGTFDASLVFVLGTVDVTGSTALAIVVLYRFVLFVPITVVGFLLLMTRYGGLGRLRLRPT